MQDLQGIERPRASLLTSHRQRLILITYRGFGPASHYGGEAQAAVIGRRDRCPARCAAGRRQAASPQWFARTRHRHRSGRGEPPRDNGPAIPFLAVARSSQDTGPIRVQITIPLVRLGPKFDFFKYHHETSVTAWSIARRMWVERIACGSPVRASIIRELKLALIKLKWIIFRRGCRLCP